MIVQAVQRVEEVMEANPGGGEKGIDTPAELPPSGRMLGGGRRPPPRDNYVPYIDF